MPLSVEYNIRNIRNNSLNQINLLSYKNIRKENLEDLPYDKLKKDKIGHMSGKNFRSSGLGDDINVNINNINNNIDINNKKQFPIIHKGKSN